jgi:hypothetical protein
MNGQLPVFVPERQAERSQARSAWLGPRWALGVGAASGFAAALVAVRVLRQRTESIPESEPRPSQKGLQYTNGARKEGQWVP